MGDKTEKLHARVSSFKTSAHAKISKGGKSPATRLKRKKANVEAEVEKACVELNAWNARLPEMEAYASELKKQLEQSAPQVRIAESKYSLLYDETQTLKQRLATDMFCDGEREQRLINASKHDLRYMDTLHAKPVKF